MKKKNPAAVALGKLGGRSKSEKKQEAARENGKKGGRPVKCNCPMPKDRSKITHNYWQEGESRYKWNKAGTFKDSQYVCEKCGREVHFVAL